MVKRKQIKLYLRDNNRRCFESAVKNITRISLQGRLSNELWDQLKSRLIVAVYEGIRG